MNASAAPLLTKTSAWTLNQVLFATLVIIILVSFPPLAQRQPWQETFSTYVIAIVLESVPYILIGSLIGTLIDLFLPATLLPGLVRRLGLASIPATALVAPAFPACECGVLAVARGLMRKGLPLPQTVTYLLAGPVLNPTVLFTTWWAFRDWRYPVFRALGGLVVAVAVGLMMQRIRTRSALLPSFAARLPSTGDDGNSAAVRPSLRPGVSMARHDPHLADLRGLWSGPGGATVPASRARPPFTLRMRTAMGQVSAQVIDHFLEMAAFFLLGVFIAAAMRTWIGTQTFAHLGTGAVVGPLVMMGAAFILSLCAEADAFIAVSFTEFALPAQIAFLVFGPMFDIKLFLMYRSVFRGWFIAVLAAAITIAVLLYITVVTYLL